MVILLTLACALSSGVIAFSPLPARFKIDGDFKRIAGGVWDAWNASDPENVNQGRFAMVHTEKNLYLVSRRLFRQGSEHPWDSAARGGIVSALNLNTSQWNHTSYDRLDEDTRGERIFAMKGHMFMMTYSHDNGKIAYHKLFYWREGYWLQKDLWVEVPLHVAQDASTISRNAIEHLSISVPDHRKNEAYFTASAHDHAGSASEMAFSKLTVYFAGSMPLSASLDLIVRHVDNEPSAVFFTMCYYGKLYALVEHFYSEGYNPETKFAYSVNLETKEVSKVTLTGTGPPMGYDEERMFQAAYVGVIAGGTHRFGFGESREVREIWSLSLWEHQWQSAHFEIPEGIGSVVAYDQNHKLFVAGLKEGVSSISAKLSNVGK